MGKRIDLTGKKFGRLTVIEFYGLGRWNNALWKCKCDCGKETIVSGRALRSGNTKSCGCYNREQSTNRIVSLNKKHGMTNTRLFRIWSGMHSRCYNPKTNNYQLYGGRGIYICEEWLKDFRSFEKWAHENGYKDNLSIDRIDNDGPYSPDNCRWATSKEQCNNRRSNKVLFAFGESKTLEEWAEIVGISSDTISKRLNSGRYSVEEAISEPCVKRGVRRKEMSKRMAEYARRRL